MQAVSDITEKYLRPLCHATERLFRPLHFHKKDRLELKTDKTGENFLASVYSLNEDGAQGWASYAANTNFIGRVPERKVLGSQGWWLAGTDMTALIINALWPADQIVMNDEARILYEYLITRFMSQTVNAKERARFRNDKAAWYVRLAMMPQYRFIDNPGLPLADYQKVGFVGCHKQESSALFMEQGTGKTPIVIARICNEAGANGEKRMYRALVVCPKNVRMNWLNEFVRFATVPGKVAVMRGGALERTKILIEAFEPEPDCKWTVVIASYESVKRSWAALRMIEWDLGVLDESQYIKNTYTKRFKKIIELRLLCKQRMCLTGTPITNTLLDLYAQLEFLGRGLSGFTTWKAFRSYYGKYIKRDRGSQLVGYKNVPILQERLARLSFNIRKAEALPDLPDKVSDIVEVEMTTEQLDIYKRVQRELIVEIEAMLSDGAATVGKTMTMRNVLTKLLRLAQITSGFVTWDAVYGDEGEELRAREVDRLDPNPKLEALVELLKNKKSDEKSIVWACWVQDIKSIAARLRLEGVDCVTYYGGTSDKDREIAERRFNEDPACKVFIGNPAAGGVGLNLVGYDWKYPETAKDTNCGHVIYYSQNWSPTARSQSEDRSHRRGTRVHVRYTDLVVPGTIDEEIRVRVLQKHQMALEVQDVRNIMKVVLETIPDVGD